MNNEELLGKLKEIRNRRKLRLLAQLSGVGYSYITKLVCHHKSIDRISDVYRQALEKGTNQVLNEKEEQHGGAA